MGISLPYKLYGTYRFHGEQSKLITRSKQKDREKDMELGHKNYEVTEEKASFSIWNPLLFGIPCAMSLIKRSMQGVTSVFDKKYI